MKLILGTMTFGGQVDAQAAREMINEFRAAGNNHIDTAHVYCDGKTETLLGKILAPEDRADRYLATKVNPWNDGGLRPQSVDRQFRQSLQRLESDRVDLLYLHSPDLDTPVRDTLEACWRLFEGGTFTDFGVSNYAAWQVAEIVHQCELNGWMRPSVYQGMYNALTRDVERELFPCLRNYGISFYAYNPLAGGLLTGKYKSGVNKPETGRFAQHEAYRGRYWKDNYFAAMEDLHRTCTELDIAPTAAALRWLVHHSSLTADAGDGIVLGASRVSQLQENMIACTQGPLPDPLLQVLDRGWDATRPDCMKYFRP